MGRTLYAHPSDNVAGLVTPVVNTGTEDPDYPAAYLVDGNPARPAQLTTTSGSWVWDFGAAQRVDLVAIPMHNLAAGVDVKIQGHTANSWGTPSLSVAIPIPTYREDGFPFGSWVDLTGAGGYSTGGYRYWRVVVTNAAVAIKVGEVLLLATKRTLNPNVKWGVREPEDRALVEHRTEYQVSTVYDLGVTMRGLEGDLETTAAGLAALRLWWRSCRGRSRACVLIPDENVNDVWLVRFAGRAARLEPSLLALDYAAIPLEFEEVGRGLVL